MEKLISCGCLPLRSVIECSGWL